MPLTHVSIVGELWHLNGRPTLANVSWQGRSLTGLLPNARMVNAILDDANEATRHLWNYPDGPWDPDRHTSEFIESLVDYRSHGLLAVTVSLMGGSICGNDPIIDKSHPQCSEAAQERKTSAFDADGSLRVPYFDRLSRVLDRTDALGMAVFLQ